MKRLVVFLLILVLVLPSAIGCTENENDGKINIVCTLFPQYDWLRNIIGESDSIELTLLIQNGSDPHSYQPTAADILTISNCDMIVYIGAESDLWVKEALERSNNKDIVKVALSSIDGITRHDISSSHHHDDHEHTEDGAFDEHIWLSLKNASVAADHLADKLCELDEANSSTYKANAQKYKNELCALDEEYAQAAARANGEHPFVLFADRFPFVYLLEDYGIDYAAAFEGCTTDVDADFDTVLRLIKEAEAHRISHIAVTESSDRSLAQTVASSAKQDIEIIVMNSLQSVNKKQLCAGYTYLSQMKKNLSALKIALGA